MKTVSVILLSSRWKLAMDNHTKHLALFDSLGIATSWLCLLHCLALPVLALILPALRFHHHDDQTHFLLAGWVVVFATVSIISGYKSHNNTGLVWLTTIGVVLVLLATFAHLPESLELLLITLGNVLVIASHHLNRRFRCSGTLACTSHTVRNATEHP